MKILRLLGCALALFASACANRLPTSPASAPISATGGAPTAEASGSPAHVGQMAQPRVISSTGTQDVHSLAFDPVDKQTLYFGHHNGVLVSTDLGETWTPGTLQGSDAMSLAMPAAGAPYYAAGHEVFFVSTDQGQTWSPGTAPVPQADIHGFGASPSRPERVFAQVAGQGVWLSDDGAQTWQPGGTGLPPTVFGLAVGPGDPPVVYVGGGQAGGIYRSLNGGATFEQVSAASLPAPPISLTVDPSGAVLAATQAGVFRSTDQATTWSRLGALPAAAAVAVDPDEPDTLVAVDMAGQVYRSTDGGQTW